MLWGDKVMQMTKATLLSWDNTYILTEGEPSQDEICSLEPVQDELSIMHEDEVLETRAITIRYVSDGENIAEDLMLIADNLVSALQEGIVKPTKVRSFSLKRA